MSEYWFPWISTLLALGIGLILYFKRHYSYWERLNVSGPPPLWLIGNIHQRFFANLRIQEVEWTQKYGKVYGEYLGLSPTLTVASPSALKQMLIKDFHLFTNRMEINSFHELINKNLFFANDINWKRLRAITSPSFSSGKLKTMSAITQRCIDKLEGHLARLTANPSRSGVVEEWKQTTAGFTLDVIASTAFAQEIDANADAANAFVVNGRKLLDISPFRGLATFMLPKWMLRLFHIDHFFSPTAFNFFIDLTKHMLKARQEAGVDGRRADLMQLLLDAGVDEEDLKKLDYGQMTVQEKEVEVNEKSMTNDDGATKNSTSSSKRKLTDSEIIANCIFFYIAGFETTASTLSHLIFELARNLPIQDRLFEHLNQTLGQFQDNKYSEQYFSAVLNQLPYLEAVIKETLRKYPPVVQMTRVCAQEGYQLDGVPLRKGQTVIIPIIALHLDPDFFPEPLRFNPERFMPENRDRQVPYSFLPFSLGPRNCIAMRFAYQEIKLCLASILLQYRFEPTPETPAELSFKNGGGFLIPAPFSIKVVRR